jgi:hypothetical protein
LEEAAHQGCLASSYLLWESDRKTDVSVLGFWGEESYRQSLNWLLEEVLLAKGRIFLQLLTSQPSRAAADGLLSATPKQHHNL